MAKTECCLLNYILDITDSTGTKQDLVRKHTLLSETSFLTSKDKTGNKQDLLIRHILLSEASVLASNDETWSAFTAGMTNDDKYKNQNHWIKSNMLGKFLLESRN